MKGIKIAAVLILSLILLTAECAALGFYALDRALSEDAIEETVKESGIIGQLADEALQESTVSMGGEYGDMAKAILETDAMMDFFAEYTAAALHAQVYGNVQQEIADDELMEAFSRGIDQVNESGSMTISPLEAEFLRKAMQAEIPDLTASLSEQISRYDALGGDTEAAAEADRTVSALTGIGTKLLSLVICLGALAGLIALCWKSKLGLIWGAIVTALASLIYGGLYLIGADAVLSVTSASPVEEMALSMVTGGFRSAALAGAVITAVLLVAFVVLRLRNRRTRNEENTAPAERFVEGDR